LCEISTFWKDPFFKFSGTKCFLLSSKVYVYVLHYRKSTQMKMQLWRECSLCNLIVWHHHQAGQIQVTYPVLKICLLYCFLIHSFYSLTTTTTTQNHIRNRRWGPALNVWYILDSSFVVFEILSNFRSPKS
jgi:hypothetical protein